MGRGKRRRAECSYNDAYLGMLTYQAQKLPPQPGCLVAALTSSTLLLVLAAVADVVERGEEELQQPPQAQPKAACSVKMKQGCTARWGIECLRGIISKGIQIDGHLLRRPLKSATQRS